MQKESGQIAQEPHEQYFLGMRRKRMHVAMSDRDFNEIARIWTAKTGLASSQTYLMPSLIQGGLVKMLRVSNPQETQLGVLHMQRAGVRCS